MFQHVVEEGLGKLFNPLRGQGNERHSTNSERKEGLQYLFVGSLLLKVVEAQKMAEEEEDEPLIEGRGRPQV